MEKQTITFTLQEGNKVSVEEGNNVRFMFEVVSDWDDQGEPILEERYWTMRDIRLVFSIPKMTPCLRGILYKENEKLGERQFPIHEVRWIEVVE